MGHAGRGTGRRGGMADALALTWGHHEIAIGPGRAGKAVWAVVGRPLTEDTEGSTDYGQA